MKTYNILLALSFALLLFVFGCGNDDTTVQPEEEAIERPNDSIPDLDPDPNPDPNTDPDPDPESDKITPLGGVDFNGLSDGQSITALVDYWGTYGNGCGSQGDTNIKRPGKTSSANMSIQAGTTGRPGDGTPAGNGDFGFILTLNDKGHNITEGEEFWMGTWLFIPEDFEFKSGTATLKFIRFAMPTGGKVETQIMGVGAANSTGFFLGSEAYPQRQEFTHRDTESVLIRGEWNFVSIYIKASVDQDKSVHRVWVNDQFAMEHVGNTSDVTTKWLDPDGALQTQTWVPTSGNGGKWAILDESSVLHSIFLFTYWNSNSPKDQSINVQELFYLKDGTNLATDEYGNKYIKSDQL